MRDRVRPDPPAGCRAGPGRLRHRCARVCDADIAGAACRHPGTLTPAATPAVRMAAALVGVELQERYGCPDCADGGASGVLLRRGGGGVESTPTRRATRPPSSRRWTRWCRNLLGDLARCESTDRVTVFPGCEPRPEVTDFPEVAKIPTFQGPAPRLAAVARGTMSAGGWA
ncbi:MAG: hypothetical protein R3F43_28605 [bacterium]